MIWFKQLASVGLILGATLASADESGLRQRLVAEDGWVGYHVPIVTGSGAPCCYSNGLGGMKKSRCDLDTRTGTFVSNDSASGSSDELSVYWHVGNGKPDKLRAFAADCPVSSRENIRWIDPVDAKDSVATTAAWIGSAGGNGDSMELAALALQAEASATAALASFAAPEKPVEMRKDAIFWLGQARGHEGAGIVEKFASSDPSADLREHAVFSLSQSREEDAYERVRNVSRKDASGEVRSKALFWMAQMKDPRAAADIGDALSSETSDEVREQAVFALSQLDGRGATSALINVVRGDYPRSVKEKALFWLAQTGTDEAMAFLDQVLTK